MNFKIRLVLFTVLVLACGALAFSQAPSAPGGLTVHHGLYGGAALRWDTASGATGYKIYRSADHSEFRGITAVEHREYLDWWVYPGHSYEYFVTAFNGNGESNSSDTVAFRLDEDPPSDHHKIISGKVIDDNTGLPIREAVIRLFSRGGLWTEQTHTDTGGTYRTAVDTGNYVLRAERFGYVSEWFDNVRRLDSATVVSIHQDTTVTANFGLQPLPHPVPITVSGMVTDSITGQPLPNAFVAFLRPHRSLRELEVITGLFGGFDFERYEIPEIGELHGVVWAGKTDSSGNYNAHLVAGLRYIAFAFKPGFVVKFYQDKSNPFEADRLFLNNDTSGIDFSLLRNPVAVNTLSGTVMDSSGTGIPSHVILLRRTLFGRLPVRFRMTDSLGNYTLYHVVPGTFYVKAIPVEGFAPAWYSASNCGVSNWHNADSIPLTGSISGINICVVPSTSGGFAHIGGEIHHGSGGNLLAVTPVQGVNVYAVDNVTNQVVGYDVTEDDGSYSIDNIPAGSYQIVVDKEGFATTGIPTVTVDGSSNYDVTNAPIAVTPEAPLSVGDPKLAIPTQYRLEQNYPNPFNPTTQIRFSLARASIVSLKIYNLIGQEVSVLTENTLAAGAYTVRWNGNDQSGRPVSSGIYFVKMVATPSDGTTAPYSEVRKMMMMK